MNENYLKLQHNLKSDRQVVKVGDDSSGLLLKDNRVFVEQQPSEEQEVATKKYVDDNAGGDSSSAKTFMDWYYYGANLASLNKFYVSTHHDEFGVTNIILSNSGDYNDTTGEDMWRTIRYGVRRIPFIDIITKFMAQVDSSGASAD